MLLVAGLARIAAVSICGVRIIHGRWDLERDSATAKIAQRQKSAGTIRQAAWPVARGRTKPPPRTRPPLPCQGRPRHIHPAGADEEDQSTFSHI